MNTFENRRLAEISISISMVFAVLFLTAFACNNGNSGEEANSPVVDETDSTAENSAGELGGKWYFRSIISADGSETRLNNSESSLTFSPDGTFEKNFGAYPNWSQSSGTYSTSGGQVTLNDTTYGTATYASNFEADGRRLVLKKADGSGLVLEK